jgi:hypothetical protein
MKSSVCLGVGLNTQGCLRGEIGIIAANGAAKIALRNPLLFISTQSF